jgi:signal transduction histidine kinase
VPTGTQAFRFRQYPIDRDDPRQLPDPYVKAIHEDRRGSLWVGLWAIPGGLFLADARREFFARFSHDPLNPSSLASNLVRVIRDDAEGYLWIGMTGGLSRIHLDSLSSATFYNYPSRALQTNSLSHDDVFSLLIRERNKEKDVWVGTYAGGVNRLDPQKGEFTHYRPDPAATHYVCSDRITTVYEDRRGNIWAGTLSGVAWLVRQSDGTARFECFGEEDGLLHDQALAILEDDHGSIWVTTLGGLSRFDPSTRRFTNFYSGIHLPITEFNVNAASTGANGRMYFGGVNGFIHFHPDSIRIQNEPPSVVITSLKVFEKEVRLDTSIILKKEVRLSHDEDFLSFEFAALDFREPARNRYAYKMEGLNSEWVQIGNRRYVSFSNLEPKEYTLRVKASNNDGVWNEEGTALRIVIEPPFWMTTWFRLASAAILLLALTVTIRQISTRKLRRRLHEMEIREKVQEERERISNDLHDHIGANLTNLATGLEVSQRYALREDDDNLKDNLSYLEKHTRSTIEALRETIWSLNLESGSAGLLMQRIEDFLEVCRRVQTGVVLAHSFVGDEKYPLSPAEALNLYRICQETVNNALKHAMAKKIAVTVKTETDVLILHISDDGVGFEPSEETAGAGYGLAGIRRRASRIGAEVCIRSAQGSGTVVEVRLKSELSGEERRS